MWHSLELTTEHGTEHPSPLRFQATLQKHIGGESLETVGTGEPSAMPEEFDATEGGDRTTYSNWHNKWETMGVREAGIALSKRFPHASVVLTLEWSGDGGPSVERELYCAGELVELMPQVMQPVALAELSLNPRVHTAVIEWDGSEEPTVYVGVDRRIVLLATILHLQSVWKDAPHAFADDGPLFMREWGEGQPYGIPFDSLGEDTLEQWHTEFRESTTSPWVSFNETTVLL